MLERLNGLDVASFAQGAMEHCRVTWSSLDVPTKGKILGPQTDNRQAAEPRGGQNEDQIWQRDSVLQSQRMKPLGNTKLLALCA